MSRNDTRSYLPSRYSNSLLRHDNESEVNSLYAHPVIGAWNSSNVPGQSHYDSQQTYQNISGPPAVPGSQGNYRNMDRSTAILGNQHGNYRSLRRPVIPSGEQRSHPSIRRSTAVPQDRGSYRDVTNSVMTSSQINRYALHSDAHKDDVHRNVYLERRHHVPQRRSNASYNSEIGLSHDVSPIAASGKLSEDGHALYRRESSRPSTIGRMTSAREIAGRPHTRDPYITSRNVEHSTINPASHNYTTIDRAGTSHVRPDAVSKLAHNLKHIPQNSRTSSYLDGRISSRLGSAKITETSDAASQHKVLPVSRRKLRTVGTQNLDTKMDEYENARLNSSNHTSPTDHDNIYTRKPSIRQIEIRDTNESSQPSSPSTRSPLTATYSQPSLASTKESHRTMSSTYTDRTQASQGTSPTAICGLIGLMNLGNTCFMNSGLQCLSNIPSLRSYFLDGTYKHHLNLSSPTRGDLAKAWASLMRHMWDPHQTNAQRPSKLKMVIGRVASRFLGYDQQDAQEFLRFMVDALHDDLNKVSSKVPYEELTDPPNESDELVSQKWWNHYCRRNDSAIKDIFAGQLKSSVICGSCKHVSRCFDPFWDLSVPIPQSAQARHRWNHDTCNSNPSLLDCLKAYVTPELLSNDYTCPKCRQTTSCHKQLKLFRLPNVLVIHLKRFSFSPFRRSKLNTSIDIPLKRLDLTPFLANTATMTEQQHAQYDLVAVSNHIGSLGGGHYTADARNSITRHWYNFNDSRVKRVSSTSISGSNAYILFYQRR